MWEEFACKSIGKVNWIGVKCVGARCPKQNTTQQNKPHARLHCIDFFLHHAVDPKHPWPPLGQHHLFHWCINITHLMKLISQVVGVWKTSKQHKSCRAVSPRSHRSTGMCRHHFFVLAPLGALAAFGWQWVEWIYRGPGMVFWKRQT